VADIAYQYQKTSLHQNGPGNPPHHSTIKYFIEFIVLESFQLKMRNAAFPPIGPGTPGLGYPGAISSPLGCHLVVTISLETPHRKTRISR
jgi:hypothetical protein